MAFAQLTDVRCYYELRGSGAPLLLIGGLGNNCRLWDSGAEELARDFSLITPDNRGVGQSVARRTPHTLGDLAADMVELLDFLQVEKCHVLGISLGGVIAQRLAIEHPSRVDRMVLISCASRFWPYLTQITRLLGKMALRVSMRDYQRMMELLGTSPNYYDDNLDKIEQKIAAASAGCVTRKTILQQLRCLAASEVPLEEFRIDAPTLVLSGEYDAIVPNCYARRMAQRIPGSRFEILRDCGHNPLDEAPERVIPKITAFLKDQPNILPERKEPALMAWA